MYVYFGSYGLLAYDLTGTEVRRYRLPLLASRNGSATSPILVDGRLVLQPDGMLSSS
jgi:hypothetical protein